MWMMLRQRTTCILEDIVVGYNVEGPDICMTWLLARRDQCALNSEESGCVHMPRLEHTMSVFCETTRSLGEQHKMTVDPKVACSHTFGLLNLQQSLTASGYIAQEKNRGASPMHRYLDTPVYNSSPKPRCTFTSLQRQLAEQPLLSQQVAAIVQWARRARQRLRTRPGRWH